MGGGRSKSKSKSKSKKKKLSGRERAQKAFQANKAKGLGTASAAAANRASGRAAAAARHAASQAAKSDKAMSKAGVSGVGPVASGRTYANALKNTTQGIGPVASGSNYARSLETVKKQQEAAKKEATRKSMFDSSRLYSMDKSPFTGLKGLESFQNFGYRAPVYKPGNQMRFGIPYNDPGRTGTLGNFGNWFDKGVNKRIGNEARVGFGTAFADDVSQMGKFKNIKTGKFETGLFGSGIPKNWNQVKQTFQGEGGFGFSFGKGADTGPTGIQRMLVRRVLPYAGQIGLGRDIFNQGRADSATTKAISNIDNVNVGGLSIGFNSPESTDIGARAGRFFTSIPGKVANLFSGDETKVASTDAGGLNIGKTPSETEGGRNIRSLKQVTDVGDKRDEATDARTNSLLNTAFNIGSNIPFVGPQLQNLKSDIKPYTDRITVETPKNTKKVISEFVGNLDSMSDTTRRFVNEFATDNPNIPNRLGLETAADVVQTLNPMNKNYAPQLSTSWSKPLQAIANNFVSGGTKNIFQEAALNTGAEGSISPAEGLSIARRIGQNINTPGTLGNFEATKLKNLADKYGGGTVKPTPGTIFRGITGNRGGNTRNQTLRSGSGSAIANAATTPEEFIIPEIPQRELSNLQDITQRAYDQQMSIYGVPNYTAQFQPRQYVKPLQFSQYFNRNKIPKLRNQFA